MKKITAIILSILLSICFINCNTKSAIEKEVEAAKEQCPQFIEAGVTWTDIVYHNNTVTYTHTVDEDIYNFDDDFILAKDLIKENLINELQNVDDSNFKLFKRLVIEENANIEYKYVGNQTNLSMSIIILPSQLSNPY